MALLHQATLSPTKLELVTAQLDRNGLGDGPVTLVGGYRFDDPAGQVGVEGLIATRDGEGFHIPVTYRDAPLDGAEPWLLTTMEHSVLGTRWVYDAAHDPVAVECFLRVLAGEQEQAVLNVYDSSEHLVEVRTPPVIVTVRRPGVVAQADLVLVHRLSGDAVDDQAPVVEAGWADGQRAVVAHG